MNRANLNASLFLFFVLSVFSEPLQSAPNLIGGDYASGLQFRSAVRIKDPSGVCTASKIGEYTFITAAHCIVNRNTGEISGYYQKNEVVLIENHSGYKVDAKIVKAIAHPTYIKALQKRVSNSENTHGIAFEAFDVGIIQIETKTEAVLIGTISDTEVKNELVYIGGYGRTALSEASSHEPKYKYSLEQKFYSPAFSRELADIDVYKDTQKFNLLSTSSRTRFYVQDIDISSRVKGADIALGDSGGPVYRALNHAIIGVNSQSIHDDNDQNIVNLHTRLAPIISWVRANIL